MTASIARPPIILAIDQGTTSSRAILMEQSGQIVDQAQQEFPQYFPQNGWVEHDPEEIYQSVVNTCQQVLKNNQLTGQDIAAIGITNQRETTLVWHRSDGQPIYKAIVWQDRRTDGYCQALKSEGHEPIIQSKTGLLLDPYFSASKLAWILDNVEGARDLAERGELCFGTVDSYLIWRLTEGKQHVTDCTNASRTMLFNIHTQEWDTELLRLFNIPASVLPEVKDCADHFGQTASSLFTQSIPIAGVAGDQQAAMIGQACFSAGMAKSTYGTGCFFMVNTGEQARKSEHKLLTTPAYRLGGQVSYALEGSIFMAGAIIQWLRDGINILNSAKDSYDLAIQANANSQVIMVPAFTGLGAPHWDAQARGAILGMTRDTGVAEITAAAIEAVAFQSKDLQKAMEADGQRPTHIRVDGGMVANDFLLQTLSNMLGGKVDRPQVIETTAKGAAYLAGLQVNVFDSLQDIEHHWQLERRFEPVIDTAQRNQRYQMWLDAVNRIKSASADIQI